MTRKIFDAVGLTASRTALLHLTLASIPFRFGLQPLGLEINKYIPMNFIGAAGSVFESRDCSEVELFLIRDFGTRLILYHSLAWIVWLVMRQSTANLKAFHKLLIATSLGNLMAICWEQNIFHPAPPDKPLDHNLFREVLVCYGVAILLSSWTTLVYSKPPLEAMKWSIPANAIFWGGVSAGRPRRVTIRSVYNACDVVNPLLTFFVGGVSIPFSSVNKPAHRGCRLTGSLRR